MFIDMIVSKESTVHVAYYQSERYVRSNKVNDIKLDLYGHL